MRALLSRFRAARDGLAAVEFALILPVMVVLFFGVIELSLALTCRADVTNMASAAADLVAQEQAVTTSDMSNVFNASTAILYPYKPGPAKITVTSVIYDTKTSSLTSGKVAWSCTYNKGKTYNTGDTVTLPAGLMTADGSVIVSEVSYDYKSPTTQIVTGTKTMANTFYTRPRRVAQITGPGTCPA